MKINLDISGMYYSRQDIEMPEGSSVNDVMMEAARLDSNSAECQLRFAGETTMDGREHLSSIEVNHLVAASSRQDRSCKYPAGRYVGRNTPVSIVESSVDGASPVIATDDGNARSVLTWQYSIYDANFVDKSRKAGSDQFKQEALTSRLTSPSSVCSTQNALQNGDTIVWRLVAIFIKPTFPFDQPVAIVAA